MKTHYLFCAILLATATVSYPTGLPIAQHAGSLDVTFDGDGKRVDRFIPGGGSDSGSAVLVQPDGRILTVGQSENQGSYVCSATRHFPDGTLDPSFGNGGKVLLENILAITCGSAALQSDGKIVAAGSVQSVFGATAQYDFALVRFNVDGSLDEAFDGDGKVVTTISSNDDFASSVAIQPDGRIVVAGVSRTPKSDIALVRYNPDGSLDATFDNDGILTTSIGKYDDAAFAVAIQADGKIVVAGDTIYDLVCDPKGKFCVSFYGFGLVRYNADGTLDTTFDNDGTVTTVIGDSRDGAKAIAIQPDGKIVAAGSTVTFGGSDFAVARYNVNGSLDVTFDGDGIVRTTVGVGYDSILDIAVQPDGKFVAAGWASSGSQHYDFAVVRYGPNGALDTSFDGDGKVFTSTSSTEEVASSVALQLDGKIVAGGFSNGRSTDFTLVRYNSDGSLDVQGFAGGIVKTDIGTGYLSPATAVAVQTDGKIVVISSGPNGLALLRYLPDGSLDLTFDQDGRVTTTFGSMYGSARAIVIQSDGRIVVGGLNSDGGLTGDFALMRYNSDGSLDPTFDGDGRVSTSFGPADDDLFSLAIQPDGKIIAAGYSRNGTNGFDFALARYNPDGSLDLTFDGDGRVTSGSFGSDLDTARAVAIQPNGKIVAAGDGWGLLNDFALARYNIDGSLDTAFDSDGIVITNIVGSNFNQAGRDAIYGVAIQPDGKIVAAGGASDHDNNDYDFALVRYNPDGSLDTGFDGDGKVVTSLGPNFDGLKGVAIDDDGKIVVAGSSEQFDGYDFVLARYNPDGSLDPTFGGDGISIVDFNDTRDAAFAMALDSQDRAVVAGESSGGVALARFLLVPVNTPYDFDGDGRADISVFRPPDSVWYLDRSTQGFSATQFGLSTDRITPADYDGDGKTDIAVYRGGVWYWLKSSDNSFHSAQFGLPADVPVPADFTGDGRAELAIYRDGVWWSFDHSNNQVSTIRFGLVADRPIVADHDGDGRVDEAVYRNGVWHLNRSSLGYTAVQFGLAADKPVVGDYDGDGNADPGVYRDGTWYLLQSTNGFTAIQWGLSTDIPVPADYDGDGRTDVAVYRDGFWYLLQSTGGFAVQNFGLASDKPVPSAYVGD